MAGQNVMRSFMMKLGFRVDDHQERKFDRSVAGATKNAVGLKTALVGVAAAATAGVLKMERDFNHLNRQSKNLGTTAKSLESLRYAYQQVAGDAGIADSALGKIRSSLNANPEGFSAQVAQYGVDVRDQAGELLGAGKILESAQQRIYQLKKNDRPYLAHHLANEVGLSGNAAFQAATSGQLRAARQEYLRQFKSVPLNQMAKQAHRFAIEIQKLVTAIKAVALEAYNDISKKLGGSLQDLAEYLLTHRKQLASTITEWAEKAGHFAETAGYAIKGLVEDFNALNRATHGWAGTLTAAAAALQFASGGVFGQLLAGAAAGAAVKLTFSKGGIVALSAAIGHAVGSIINTKFIDGTKFGDALGSMEAHVLAWLGYKPAQDAVDAMDRSKQPNEQPPRISKQQAGENPLDTSTWLRGHGFSRAGTAAILANIKRESGFDPKARGDHGHAYGMFQWHIARVKKILKNTGIDVRTAGFTKQLQAFQWELKNRNPKLLNELQTTANASQGAAHFSRQYERPAAVDAEARKRGALADKYMQTITNHVTINAPNSNADEIAQKVQRAQDDSARQAIRNKTATVR